MEDRKSMLLGGGVQAKPMVQRMALADAELDEAKKLADAGTGTRIQKAGFVSSPEDASEREADKVADAVVSAPAPEVGRTATAVQRMAGDSGAAPATGKGGADIEVEARIRAAAVGGKPLSRKTRALLEPRFDADFSNVRIHDDSQAARLSTRIGARAFAYGNHIFFNEGQFQPDTAAGQHLLAHELTHTIQQRASVQRKSAGGPAGVHVDERTGPQASRLGVSDALDYFAEAAYNIPGFRMFTILIGVNPINMRDVDRSAANILRAIVEFLPGGVLVTTVLDQFGVFDRAGTFVEEQLASLGITGDSIRAAINAFLDDLSWDDIFDLDGVWERAKRIFTDPIDRIITFVGALFDQIVTFVREAVLSPLAALVEPTEGYGLLKQILGYDPITGEQVERDVGAIVGGLLRLAGQEELWNNIQEANALERIGAWFTGALDSLIALVVSIPDRFVEAFEQIEITDFIDLPGAVARVLGVFGSIVVDFGAWILDTVLTLLTIIVEVVAPEVMPYLQRAGKAFDTIVADPIAFVGNLVAAAKRGFELFSRNFVPNLRSALIQWLTGAMAGANIHIPQAFSLQEILKFVLSVLGLTWENVRPKLVRVLGETAVIALETGFELVTTLVTEGPAAAWQQIVEMIGNLQEMVIEKIISFVTEQVIQQAVIKLVSFLNPAGALIQAIIAIYNTVMFFVERLSQMAQVAAAFIDGIAEIAEGKLDGAAAKVEQTMVGLLSLVISFLARLVGLGNVARAVTDLIEALRRPIDAALDRLIDWIVQQARAFVTSIAQVGVSEDPETRLNDGLEMATLAVNGLRAGRVTEALINPVLAGISARYGFRRLVAVVDNGFWWIEGEINPRGRRQTRQTQNADSNAQWRLESNDIRAAEGRILTGGQTIHLFTRHGQRVIEAEIEDRVQQMILSFTEGRLNLIAYYQQQVTNIQDTLNNIGRNPRDQRVIDLSQNLYHAQANLQYWLGINPTDRSAAAEAMQTNAWRGRAGGGPRPITELRATRFTDDHVLERSILRVLSMPAMTDRIDHELTARPQNPVRVTEDLGINLGFGYEMNSRQQAVRISSPLTRVTFIVRASDEARKLYVIETGWPHP